MNNEKDPLRHAKRIIKKIDEGNGTTADFVTQNVVSIQQHNRASSPRLDALSRLITDHLHTNWNASTNDIKNHLFSLKGLGVIEDCDDDEKAIIWSPGKNKSLKTTPYSALPSRITRCRKRIQK